MRTRPSWLNLPMAALASVMIVASMSAAARAAEVKVAVAANFTDAVKEIGALFEKASGHKAVFSFGPTGGLYNQITQAAPFESFSPPIRRGLHKLSRKATASRGAYLHMRPASSSFSARPTV